MSIFGDIWGVAKDLFNGGMSLNSMYYQRDMDALTREREDNAVQRRKADLIAAGLSPVLAAGDAASTHAPINAGVPQIGGDGLFQSVQMESARKQQALTDAQLDLVNTQVLKEDALAQSAMVDRQIKSEQYNALRGDTAKGATNYIAANAIKEAMATGRKYDDVLRNSNMARDYGVPTDSAGANDAIATTRMLDKALGGNGKMSPAAAGLLQIGKMLIPLLK